LAGLVKSAFPGLSPVPGGRWCAGQPGEGEGAVRNAASEAPSRGGEGKSGTAETEGLRAALREDQEPLESPGKKRGDAERLRGQYGAAQVPHDKVAWPLLVPGRASAGM